jgi:foldase protein PrsA
VPSKWASELTPRRPWRAGALAVALALTLGLAACGGSGSGAVAVQVGHVKITQAMVAHWVAVMAGGRAPSADSPRYRLLRQRVLTYLISSQWLIGEAAQRGIVVSDREVGRRSRQIEEASFSGDNAEVQAFLKATGQRSSDVELQARTQLALTKLLGAVTSQAVPVTPAEVASYYRQHSGRYVIPEERQVKIINRKTAAAAREVKRGGVAGKSFGFAHSETFRTPNEAAAESRRGPLQKAIFSAKPSMLVGPVKDHVDYFVFELERIVPARRELLSEVKSAIARQLTNERRRRALASFDRAWTTKWSALTDCRPGFVVMSCKQYHGRRTLEVGFGVR